MSEWEIWFRTQQQATANFHASPQRYHFSQTCYHLPHAATKLETVPTYFMPSISILYRETYILYFNRVYRYNAMMRASDKRRWHKRLRNMSNTRDDIDATQWRFYTVTLVTLSDYGCNWPLLCTSPHLQYTPSTRRASSGAFCLCCISLAWYILRELSIKPFNILHFRCFDFMVLSWCCNARYIGRHFRLMISVINSIMPEIYICAKTPARVQRARHYFLSCLLYLQ